MKLLAAGLALLGGSLALADVRGPQWARVDKAMQAGLPKTAIATLDSLSNAALRSRRYPEAIRAVVQRITLEAQIQGGDPAEKIRLLTATLPNLPAATHPVLEAVLAQWYWDYFQRNRWRFLNRSQTAEAVADDFTTWDLPRLYEEIDRHYTRALASAAFLQATPIESYEDLLQKGSVSDAYRPTLYDFVVWEALVFYNAGEQAAARPQDAFVLTADTPIFGPLSTFLAWEVETPDTTSPIWKAIRLQQELLAFHRHDTDPSARLDADLLRLRFGNNHAVGPEKSARFQASLERLARAHPEHPVSALARAEWARALLLEGNPLAAWQVANVGRTEHPDTPEGNACFNLIQEIETPALTITMERVWNEPSQPIVARYKNLRRLYMRAVRADYLEWIQGNRWSLDHLRREDAEQLLARVPEREWSSPLVPTEDFLEREATLRTPSDLPSGMYYLLASSRSDFQDAPVFASAFWVSDLALVVRGGIDSGIEGFVLDATSGSPIAGARVRIWGRNGTGMQTTDSDTGGRFSFPGVTEPRWVLATFRDQELGTAVGMHTSPPHAYRPIQRTLFFTDRSLYRPGQTIHFKGLCYESAPETDEYRVLPRTAVTVVFQDVNRKEVARQSHVTNDYGSFSGTFATPAGLLLGRMSIQVSDGPGGHASVHVEEYKRPTFHVSVSPPKGEARLESDVRVEGLAMGYNGAPMDGADVQWRVVRQVRYPAWWRWRYWWKPLRSEDSQQIALGTARTATDGTFAITFPAKPDSLAAAEDEPVFQFRVHVDVTDPSGETRSADRSIPIGYATLTARLVVNSWQVRGEPVDLSFLVASLAGEPAGTEVQVQIHRLQEPEDVVRPKLGTGRATHHGLQPYGVAHRYTEIEDGSWETWPDEVRVFDQRVHVDTTGEGRVSLALPRGCYRARIEAQDAYGSPVTAEAPFQVLDPGDSQLGLQVPDLLAAPTWTVEPGGEFLALWGTGYAGARAFVEIEHRGRILQAHWTDPRRTQTTIRQRVTEKMRGGFTLRVTMVHENRAYLHEVLVSVPWSNKHLDVRWERFVSTLEPGQGETWTAVVKNARGGPAVAEMVAALYDASLDALQRHAWTGGLGPFWHSRHARAARFENATVSLHAVVNRWQWERKSEHRYYRHLPYQALGPAYGREYIVTAERLVDRKSSAMRQMIAGSALQGLPVENVQEAMALGAGVVASGGELHFRGGRGGEVKFEVDGVEVTNLLFGGSATIANLSLAEADLGIDLASITARKNLQETAFFLPHLLSDRKGEIRIQFTIPEALTEWRFLGFAHDTELRSGMLHGTAVTALDLMVQPNPPRTLREGDVLEFTVRVTNRTDAPQDGRVQLSFTHGITGESVDSTLINLSPERPVAIPAHASRTYAWRITIPDGLGVLAYRAVAASGKSSDGQEGYLPVLSRRVLVTESLPLPIRGPATREFDFERLQRSGESPTLRHQALTVQMVSNPAWYAVMALPYLMEYPYECSEQIFNRLYANALASHVARSDPKIRQVFDRWRGTEALVSPLEKNQELKAVLLEETPWVRQGERESGARRKVGVLFEQARMDQERKRSHDRLAALQLPDGAWPWFAGGRANDYITLYITMGYGRLRHLGVAVDMDPALRSLRRLDGWMDGIYRRILARGDAEEAHLTRLVALYLYGRTFFVEGWPVGQEHQEAFAYWTSQAKRYWTHLPDRQSRAHVALALTRLGDREIPRAILRSLREHAVQDEELGMFWRDTERSWWWYRAPIETQAVMIEAFDEVLDDADAVEECKVWLLKQKQTQDWKTTKATADAVYALLLRGADLLKSDALVEVSLGGEPIAPGQAEAGTGFYEHRFLRSEVRPEQGRVTVRKTDPGVAWGAVHWQYLEDVSRVTPYYGTPLKLEKSLQVRRDSPEGPTLHRVSGPVAVGDELVSRIVLRVDRDMEYVHLKDYRGSGTEPVNVLSGYRYQDGLRYYEMTRDAASHFFIDYLPKGTYVFEYSIRVQHRGVYQSGFAQIQCMYAPEFNSHSESVEIRVE